MGYRITKDAERQIIDAYIYGLENFGTDQAELYATDLYDCFDLISKSPRMASVRKGYDHPLRIHHHGKHYIIYMLMDDAEDVLILSVLREESDLAAHLRSL